MNTTTCPECSREIVKPPAGYLAPCGRRVTANDAPSALFSRADQRRDRMFLINVCRNADVIHPNARRERSVG